MFSCHAIRNKPGHSWGLVSLPIETQPRTMVHRPQLGGLTKHLNSAIRLLEIRSRGARHARQVMGKERELAREIRESQQLAPGREFPFQASPRPLEVLTVVHFINPGGPVAGICRGARSGSDADPRSGIADTPAADQASFRPGGPREGCRSTPLVLGHGW